MGFCDRRAEHTPRVYTDTPARCTRLPGGFLDFDADCNVIVHREETDWTLAQAETRLSIRCAFGGERRFQVERDEYAIDDTAYLLLNRGQIVCSSVSARTPVECLNVTFRPGFVEEAMTAMTLPVERLLDEPILCERLVGVPARTYPYDNRLAKRVLAVRDRLTRLPVTQGWLEEQFHDLAGDLLQIHGRERLEIERMPGMRLSTRTECYERMHRAREFMRASLARPVTLPDMARVACMAPHHFLRTFKLAFHQTPHQYLTHLRLERAKALLSRTDTPVTDICMEVGFESLGSFSWLFHRQCGQSPSAFRNSRR